MELPDIGSIIHDALRSVYSWVRSFVYDVVRPIWREIDYIWSSVRKLASSVYSFVTKKIGEVVKWVRDEIKGILNYIGHAINDITTWVRKEISDVYGYISRVIGDIRSFIGSVAKHLHNAIDAIEAKLRNFAEFVASAINRVTRFVVFAYLKAGEQVLEGIDYALDFVNQLTDDIAKWMFFNSYDYFYAAAEKVLDVSKYVFDDAAKALESKNEDVYKALYVKITRGAK